MAITECISLSVENKIDNNFSEAALHINETGYHGTPEFPVAIYLDDVSNKYVNWHLSINSLNFPLFSRLPAIENSIYVSFSLVFALIG